MYNFELGYIMNNGSLRTYSVSAASIVEAVSSSQVKDGILYSVACTEVQKLLEDATGTSATTANTSDAEYGYLISLGSDTYLHSVTAGGKVRVAVTEGLAMMFAPEELEQARQLACDVNGTVTPIAPNTVYATIAQILRGVYNSNTMSLFVRAHKEPLRFCHHQYYKQGYSTALQIRAHERFMDGSQERFGFCFAIYYTRNEEPLDGPEMTEDEAIVIIPAFGSPHPLAESESESGGQAFTTGQANRLSTMLLTNQRERELEESSEHDFRAEVRGTKFTNEEIEKMFVRKGPLCELGTEYDAHTLVLYMRNRGVTLHQLARQRGYTYKKICRKFRELVDVLKQYRREADDGLYETPISTWPVTSIGIQAVLKKSAIQVLNQQNIKTLAELHKCCSVDNCYIATLLGDKESVMRHTCAACYRILGKAGVACKSRQG